MQAAHTQQRGSGPAIEIAPEIQARPGIETLIPLQVSAPQGLPRNVIMLIRGIPSGVVLSEGRAFGPGVWAVPPANAGRLKVVPSAGVSGSAPISVTLVTLEGTELAEARAVLHFGPSPRASSQRETVGALPGGVLTAPPSSTGTSRETAITPVRQTPADELQSAKLVERGDEIMRTGKVTAARLLYQRAAETGSAPGALALGATYDAQELAATNVVGGVQPDPKLARQWYGMARDLGSPEAARRLQRLGTQ